MEVTAAIEVLTAAWWFWTATVGGDKKRKGESEGGALVKRR